MYRGRKLRMTVEFSEKLCKSEDKENKIFKVMKVKQKLSTYNSITRKIYLKYEGRGKICHIG